MRTDEAVFPLAGRRELRIWRSNPASYSVRLGIARQGREKCDAAVELNHEDAEAVSAAMHHAAANAFYALLEA